MGFEEMMTNAYVENRSGCKTDLTFCTPCLSQSWWHDAQLVAYKPHFDLYQQDACSCADSLRAALSCPVVASVVMLNTASPDLDFCYRQACHCDLEGIAIGNITTTCYDCMITINLISIDGISIIDVIIVINVNEGCCP